MVSQSEFDQAIVRLSGAFSGGLRSSGRNHGTIRIVDSLARSVVAIDRCTCRSLGSRGMSL